MTINNTFNTFSDGKSWQEKVHAADDIWQQIKALLVENNIELPSTPRRPDVRMIINNATGSEVQFLNPGDHSMSKQEKIPATGESTAAMVMIKGATLDEQYKNAEALYKSYDLGTTGFSEKFLSDLKDGKLSSLIDEAYGPAPFAGQSSKLVDVEWTTSEGKTSTITPQKGANASFGARAATDETVFLALFNIFVKGTNTIPELVESSGMNIAVSIDYKTKAETTRPIVPSVAKTYYGEFCNKIPSVLVHPDGQVLEIDLKNGTVLTPDFDGTVATAKTASKPSIQPPKTS